VWPGRRHRPFSSTSSTTGRSGGTRVRRSIALLDARPASIGDAVKNLFRKLLGDRGERAAIRFLKSQRMRILDRQHRNQFGEVDIIALDRGCIVFIEVKTRSSTAAGLPFEAVDRQKQQKLTRTALAWLKKRRRLDQPARFDVVSILWAADHDEPQIEHFRNAFEPQGFGQMYS
jgi:putative endonuclease